MNPSGIPEAMHRLNVTPLPIGFTTAITAGALPLIHRDPVDRTIIAEAGIGKMTVITKDSTFTKYGVEVLW